MIPQRKCDTLMIRCSDHRLAHACETFVEDILKVSDYDLVVVPGGPQFLSALEYLPKFNWAGRRWMRFLVDEHEVKRVILISHEDCGWYRHLHGSLQEHDARQQADLRRSAAHLKEIFPGLRVDAYFAAGQAPDVHFTRVEV